ncbi:MAG: NADH:flavin oxidoreductase [Candidatus Latescibacteria bacterium]|nr:NADH:flavin oxidoreductase [Candidatus Latescibacterota bacterium]
MVHLLEPLRFSHGPILKNRFMLAPLTNQQSHEDGRLSDEEFRWLTLRAKGGFGLTMTCASHVQAIGKGFSGQLGIWSDNHIAGLQRLATEIKSHDSIAIVQLHHAGMRSPKEVIGGTPVCPSDNEETGARGLTRAEVEVLIDDFVEAAVRADKAGFDGVEIHGAHSYILCQFFSSEINHRDDEYSGSLSNRFRILFKIIAGIRKRCREDFVLGVRLSPERFGMKLSEVVDIAQRLMTEDEIDFLDMSLWDVFKEPEEKVYQGRTLMSYFTELHRHNARLGVAGKIRTPQEAEATLEAGVDWIMLGRAAMLQHDFPNRYKADPAFKAVEPPVTSQHLTQEGLSDKFQDYIRPRWPEFFVDEG